MSHKIQKTKMLRNIITIVTLLIACSLQNQSLLLGSKQSSLFLAEQPRSLNLQTTKNSFLNTHYSRDYSSCGPYCNFCTFSYCQDCQTGYYLQNSTCFQCPRGCKSCSNPSTCDSCLSGFFYKGAMCDPCTTGCSDCKDPNVCSKCFEGFFMVANQKCNACIQGCATCKDTMKCQECKSYWTMNEDGTTCTEQGWFAKYWLWLFLSCIGYICCVACCVAIAVLGGDIEKRH